MNPPPLDASNRPSWLGPIFLTSLATVGVQILLGALTTMDGRGCISSFVCCAAILPLGFLPIGMVAPKDPLLRPGEGFVLSFVAVGIGATMMAAMHVLQAQGMDTSELESTMRKSIEGLPENQLTPEEVDRIVAFATTMIPYVPILFAAVMTIMAGIVGAASTAMVRRRR